MTMWQSRKKEPPVAAIMCGSPQLGTKCHHVWIAASRTTSVPRDDGDLRPRSRHCEEDTQYPTRQSTFNPSDNAQLSPSWRGRISARGNPFTTERQGLTFHVIARA